MSLVILFLAIAGAIWGLFVLRHTSIILQCLVVLVAGSVIGHSFYNVSVGPIPITLDRILFLLVLVQLGLFAWIHGHTFSGRINRVDILVCLLFVVLTTSTFIHDFRYKENLPLGRLLFLNWMPMAMYLVVRHCKISSTDVKLIFGGFLAFGLYLSFTAIAEVRGPHSIVFPKYILSPDEPEFLGRARGPFLNPVSCGIFQIVSLAAAFMFWPHSGRAGKVVLVAIAPFFLAGVFMTLTRSVWMSAAFAALIVAWVPLEVKYKAILATIGLLAGVCGFAVLGDQLDGFKRDKHVSAHEMAQSAKLRPMLATVAFRMFQDRPILGVGFGQYTKFKRPYHYHEADHMPLRMVLPYMQHNVFLSYLTETGLLGLVSFLCVLIGFSVHSWKLWCHQSQKLWARQVGLISLVAISCYLVNGMFHDSSIVPMLNMLLYFMGGLSVQLGQQLESSELQGHIHRNDWQEGPSAQDRTAA